MWNLTKTLFSYMARVVVIWRLTLGTDVVALVLVPVLVVVVRGSGGGFIGCHISDRNAFLSNVGSRVFKTSTPFGVNIKP